jgi:hypothetical protein
LRAKGSPHLLGSSGLSGLAHCAKLREPPRSEEANLARALANVGNGWRPDLRRRPVNGKVAPKPAVRLSWVERVKPTRSGHSSPCHRMVGSNQKAVARTGPAPTSCDSAESPQNMPIETPMGNYSPVSGNRRLSQCVE